MGIPSNGSGSGNSEAPLTGNGADRDSVARPAQQRRRPSNPKENTAGRRRSRGARPVLGEGGGGGGLIRLGEHPVTLLEGPAAPRKHSKHGTHRKHDAHGTCGKRSSKDTTVTKPVQAPQKRPVSASSDDSLSDDTNGIDSFDDTDSD